LVPLLAGAVLLGLAFALDPGWVGGWAASFREPTHFVAPVTRLPFGPLVLLALLRWRRPEAPLLVALACISQTNAVNDVLPLFLVAETFGESLLLGATTHAIGYAQIRAIASQAWRPDDLAGFAAYCATSAGWLVLGVYLPCLALVLRRPNVAPAREGEPEGPPAVEVGAAT
jgi:hypothetical protein